MSTPAPASPLSSGPNLAAHDELAALDCLADAYDLDCEVSIAAAKRLVAKARKAVDAGKSLATPGVR